MIRVKVIRVCIPQKTVVHNTFNNSEMLISRCGKQQVHWIVQFDNPRLQNLLKVVAEIPWRVKRPTYVAYNHLLHRLYTLHHPHVNAVAVSAGAERPSHKILLIGQKLLDHGLK